jgi:plasmid segregation protein ParM
MSADYAGDVLDTDFPLSAAYAARLYGALNYMYKGLPHHTIDYLVLGLPLSTIRQHADKLADLFVGEKTINAQGHTVQIKHVEVFPQPLGSYMAYLATAPVVPGKKMPMALVIDPGYNTVDWYVIRGTTPTDVKSGALNRGMGALLTAKAEAMLAPVAQHGCAEVQGGTVAELVRHLDARMSSGEPFTMFNRVIDIDRYKKVGLTIIEEAVQAVKNSIGLGGEIDVIIMTGGGAQTYADAVRRKFPQHYIEILAEPAFANARGFHFLGERLARSAERAMANTVPA